MDTVVCKELIVTTLARRGKGVKHSPVRVITQVYDKDGELIAESDPFDETFSDIDLIHFSRWCMNTGIAIDDIDINSVYKWIDSIETA
jgi:hypothetical protein